ncbi:zinc finger protein 23-like isoform X1 [Pieris rapae]|uniref:zinc finger protein 23-like isoform X1 n=1 Tax=Pieris rapae TaxID=64459 RepID=UPI001E27AD1D|nr:zinc finger protein 23-like isoform X1 [Pieris rapae]
MQVAVASTSKVNVVDHDDFTYLCRICAVKTHNIIPLFSKDGDDQHLVEKINKYLPIKVCNDDLLPAGVCEQCSNAVLAWHELVECCVQADVSFQNRLALSQKQGLSQSTPGIPSNSDPTLNENGIKSERMSEYLVRIVPAPLYTDTGFVISSTEAISKRTDTCHFNKQDTFKLLADVSTIYPGQQSETAKEQLMKEQFVHTDTDANWTHYSKHNTSDKQPLDYNSFVQTRTNSVDGSSHNRVVPEFPLRVNDSNEDTNNSTETKNIQNSPNSPISCVTEAAYMSCTDKIIDRFEQNEFSDHSETESFARLSESVFEAIEDTRDGIIDKPTDEIRVIEKSKRTRTCPICGKIYTASSSYFYHMKHFHRHSKEHGCDVCGKKFGTRGDLKQHAAVHTDECKYACRSCDKKFRSRASWYIHEQIHEGVKNYKCSTCAKCFRWRTHLQRHTLRHAAERKHECAVCGRGFSVHCDLLRHARTHAVGSYECEECRVKFAQIRYLKAHIRKKHSVTSTGDIG